MSLTQKLKTLYQTYFRKDTPDYKARVIVNAIESEPFVPSFSTIRYTAAVVALVSVAVAGCKKSYETDKQTKETITDLCEDVADSCDANIKNVCYELVSKYNQGSYKQRKLADILTKLVKGDEIDRITMMQYLILLNVGRRTASDEELFMVGEEFVYERIHKELTICNFLEATSSADKERKSREPAKPF